MKRLLALLLDFGRTKFRPASSFHDDTLRANQGDSRAPTFSFWRALVS
jgi:hypothetical protein